MTFLFLCQERESWLHLTSLNYLKFFLMCRLRPLLTHFVVACSRWLLEAVFFLSLALILGIGFLLLLLLGTSTDGVLFHVYHLVATRETFWKKALQWWESNLGRQLINMRFHYSKASRATIISSSQIHIVDFISLPISSWQWEGCFAQSQNGCRQSTKWIYCQIRVKSKMSCWDIVGKIGKK